MQYFMLFLTLLLIIIHVALLKQRTAAKIVEVVLLYMLVILFGAGSLMAGLFHVFAGPATAQRIGWPAGSPFQYEVGAADIAFGITALLGFFFRGNYWLAAIIANSSFLLLCMIGHLRSLAESGNLAAYNIGPAIILADLVIPLVMLVLYFYYAKLQRAK